MRALEDMKKLLESELEKINKKGDINAAELEVATKVVCLLEKIATIESMESASYEDEYSERRYSNNGIYGGYYWPDRMSYNDNSYRNNYPMRGRGSSYDSRKGYSMHDEKEMLIRKMEDLLQDAQSEKERKAIIDHIEYLKN